MLDWLGYRKELIGRIGEIGKLSPDTLRGYQTLSGAGEKTGHLDAKTRELISLAVAETGYRIDEIGDPARQGDAGSTYPYALPTE